MNIYELALSNLYLNILLFSEFYNSYVHKLYIILKDNFVNVFVKIVINKTINEIFCKVA